MHNEPTVKSLKVRVLQLQLQVKQLEGALLQYQIIDLQEAQNEAMAEYQAEHDAQNEAEMGAAFSEALAQGQVTSNDIDPETISYGDGN